MTLTLLIVGDLNWLLIALFKCDGGQIDIISRIVYERNILY
ncbi:DUF378 domain-containing protein (plasmid) [Lactobacillus curvatus]|nr:DUF378 domain-containing protein [Latilactobacillus curvatus]MSD84756.1 DUF378 domain-containing protein [Latilactobacillus curvatus]MSE23437.1 DUF378 domain-containing protein [Latilactobacillus curvatus]MSE24901.1 DUF378 domain-containing protein [Latilactobacillus curvatus]